MPSDISILSSRRSYEFPPDSIRLTMITLPYVQQLLTQAFLFQAGTVGTPQPTFGEVIQTLPPGWIGNLGSIATASGESIPIRFMHFETRRIVIDVAAPSETIDEVYERLLGVLEVLRAPDAQPVLGEPDHIRDYSEVSLRLDFDPWALFAPQLVNLLQSGVGPMSETEQAVPLTFMRAFSRTEEYLGTLSTPDSTTFQFGPRLGSRPDERLYFSGAPLPSGRHLALLQQLESLAVQA